MIRFATKEEVEAWDKRVIDNPDGGNFLQGKIFAGVKNGRHWKTFFLNIDDVYVMGMDRKVPFFGRLWYFPKGPGVASSEGLVKLVDELKSFAKSHGVFTVWIEPELVAGSKMPEGSRQRETIQPNAHTVLLDISGSEEELLKGFQQKARYAIGKAARDGVAIHRVPATDESCEKMYALLADTAKAQGFAIRDYEYYKDFWQGYEKAEQGQMFFAYVDTEVVSGAYAIIYGKKSTYKDGASVRKKTVYGASHLLQWEVIKWAKERGALVHDLCGAPPSDRIHDKTHPHHGLGQFKTSFNKEVTDYVGTWDVPIRRVRFVVWRSFGQKVMFRVWSFLRKPKY